MKVLREVIKIHFAFDFCLSGPPRNSSEATYPPACSTAAAATSTIHVPKIGSIPVQPQTSTHSDLVHNMNVPVGLGGETAIFPTNRALIRDAAVGAAALKRIVLLLGTVGPRFEQSDVASSTASAGA